MKKGMKNEIKLTKKEQDSLTGTKRQKPWRKFVGKQQKITWAGSIEGREPKSFLKSFEIVKNTWKVYVFKKPSERFLIGQKIGSIDQKSHSIDRSLGSINQKLGQMHFLQNSNSALVCFKTFRVF